MNKQFDLCDIRDLFSLDLSFPFTFKDEVEYLQKSKKLIGIFKENAEIFPFKPTINEESIHEDEDDKEHGEYSYDFGENKQFKLIMNVVYNRLRTVRFYKKLNLDKDGNANLICHRDCNFPTIIDYYSDGKIKELHYLTEGKHHNTLNTPSSIYFNPEGVIEREIYYYHGKLHRTNGPAVSQTKGYFFNENIKLEGSHYYIDNVKISEVQFNKYCSEGKIDYVDVVFFNKDGYYTFSRDEDYVEISNGLYKQITSDNTFIKKTTYIEDSRSDEYFNKNFGDEEGEIEIHFNGRCLVGFVFLGKFVHRDGDRPARVEYYKNGKIQSISYLSYGFSNRDNGPAFQTFHYNGNQKMIRYQKHGKFHRLDGPAVIKFESDNRIISEEYFIDDKNISQKEFEEKYKNRGKKSSEGDKFICDYCSQPSSTKYRLQSHLEVCGGKKMLDQSPQLNFLCKASEKVYSSIFRHLATEAVKENNFELLSQLDGIGALKKYNINLRVE